MPGDPRLVGRARGSPWRRGPSILIARDRGAELVAAARPRSTRPRKVRFGSAFESTTRASELVAVLERDAAGAPSSHDDARRPARRCGSRPRAARAGRRHRLRDRAHAADHVAHEALELVLAAGEQVEEQAERRARLVRAAVLAVDVVGEHERLDLLGLVVAVEEVAEAEPVRNATISPISSPVILRKRPPTRERLADARRRPWRARPAAARGRTAGGSAPAASAARRRAGSVARRAANGGASSAPCFRGSDHHGHDVAVAERHRRPADRTAPCAGRGRRASRSRITSGRSMLAM